MRAWAPGRVNLIGDHTDTTGGLVLPMAIDLGTTVTGSPGGTEVILESADAPGGVRVALDVDDPATVEPEWGRYVAGVVAEMRPGAGLRGSVETTLPIGGGLSSSAALEVAVALALGFRGSAVELALLCQRAEQRASGVPCGVMDQLASAAGVEDHALLIDCTALSVAPVAIPAEAEVVVVDSGEPRRLAASGYAQVAARCHAAAAALARIFDRDPLTALPVSGAEAIDDDGVRSAARHVISENQRVRDFATALAAGALVEAGRLMFESHRSLAVDLGVSTPALDSLVADLGSRPGVYGARLTGAGFGGNVVALCRPGALPQTGRPVRSRGPARLLA